MFRFLRKRPAPRTVDEIVEWFRRPLEPRIDGGDAIEHYNTFHPRTAFLKVLPRDATVVDVGAGDGSLSVFRRWPAPARHDLSMHAYALGKGEHFDAFAGYELGDWNVAPPRFEGLRFDGIVCAHFIEHIADPSSFATWAGSVLAPGGRVYLEWPSPNALDLPPRDVLAAAGVPLVISRFDDDRTHRRLPSRSAMIRAMRRSGLRIETEGLVRLPWLEDELLSHFRDAEDPFPRQAAFWSYTGWSQYLVFARD